MNSSLCALHTGLPRHDSQLAPQRRSMYLLPRFLSWLLATCFDFPERNNYTLCFFGNHYMLLIWRLFLSSFVWCPPGSWSWESLVFSIFVTQFLSGLNLDPFGFWPDQEACSWVIAHSWVCYLSVFIVRVHSALSLKWPCGPGDSCHLVCDSFHPVFASTSLRASIIPSFSQQILTIYGQGIVSLDETNTSSNSKVPLPVTPGFVWGYLFFSYLFSSIYQPNPSPKVRDTQVSQDRAS